MILLKVGERIPGGEDAGLEVTRDAILVLTANLLTTAVSLHWKLVGYREITIRYQVLENIKSQVHQAKHQKKIVQTHTSDTSTIQKIVEFKQTIRGRNRQRSTGKNPVQKEAQGRNRQTKHESEKYSLFR